MTKYKTVLFDLDGTLVDNYTAIHNTLCLCFRKFDLQEPTYEAVYRAVGGSILVTIRKLINDSSKDSLATSIGEYYMQIFNDHVFDGLKPLPYSCEVLRALRAQGLKLACFTNKQQDGAEIILKHLGLDKYLDAIIGTSLHSPRKPSAEFTLAALSILGARADTSLGVGDSLYDFQAADSCAMDCALVATGADSMEKLKQKCQSALGVYANLKDMAASVFDVAI